MASIRTREAVALANVERVLDYCRDEAPELMTMEARAMLRAAIEASRRG